MKPHATPRSRRPRPREAFTLIELLTVIVIVGILAAILIPVVSSVRASARDAQCRSALRSWGIAISLHISDHRGRLPGPLDQDVIEQIVDGSKYTNKTAKPLMLWLAPYIGLPDTETFQLPASYMCSGFVADAPLPGGPPYFSPPSQGREPPYENIYPFGKGGDQPLLHSELETVLLRMKQGIALQDMDYGRTNSAASRERWGDKIPPKLTHRRHRNTLYWDWRVAPRTYAEIQ